MENYNDYSYIYNFNIDKKPEMKLITYIDIKIENEYEMLDQETD